VSLTLIVTIISAFGLSLVCTRLMRHYALHNNLLDVPNARSSHTVPTPRGGGLAIVLAFFFALLSLVLLQHLSLKIFASFSVCGGAIALIGLLDDQRGRPAGLRFGVHLVGALLTVLLLGGVPQLTAAHWGIYGICIGGAMAIIGIVWATNLFNFMDGIDGIASVEAVFISVSASYLNWQQHGEPVLTAAALCLAAATSGFLVWNWPPARIFMGDVGSGFLGFSLAVLGFSISKEGMVPLEVWAILGGVFLVDATVTLLRRMARWDRWFEAHRSHAYQQLSRRWNSHLNVTLSVTLVNACWLLPWAWAATRWPSVAPICLVAALLPLVALAFVIGAGRREI
jgi:Fuc2NAc and GlcNAc transferase